MHERIRKIGFLGALMLTVQLLAAGVASAHGLSLTAQGTCQAGAPVISFTVTAISQGFDGVHPNVVVYFNNTAVYTGALVQATGNTFSGSAAASSGAVIAVGARAEGPWTDGATGGQEYAVLATVPSDCVAGGNGRFTGGGKQVEAGGLAKITRGLTIHCDLLLSNNLEINWDGGNNFHMLEHLETIACFDDRASIRRGRRRRSTRWSAAARDASMGRRRLDRVHAHRRRRAGTRRQDGFTITAPNGTVVANVPASSLPRGNLQAHYDQPHKK